MQSLSSFPLQLKTVSTQSNRIAIRDHQAPTSVASKVSEIYCQLCHQCFYAHSQQTTTLH